MEDTYANTNALLNMRSDMTEVQKQLVRQDVLITRFDVALDKISEVSMNVSRLLAVHEQRLEVGEDAGHRLPILIEKRHDEYIKRFEMSHDRILKTDEDLRKEMTSGHKEIIVEIKNLRGDMTHLGDELKEKSDHIKEDLQVEFDSQFDAVNSRVSKLEKLSWLVVGGSTVIGFLLSQAYHVISLFNIVG